MDPQIFEAAMLLCFAVSWPVSIRKSFLSRSNKGKSLGYMVIIVFGYLLGITGKLVSGNTGYIIFFYVLVTSLITTDILLYFRNALLEKKGDR